MLPLQGRRCRSNPLSSPFPFTETRPASLSTDAIKQGVLQSSYMSSMIQQNVCWLLACLTSQQRTSVSQGRICSDNFSCSHTEIEVAHQIFYLTQSQYTDTGPTSPSADPITPGTWQGSHWSANFYVTGMTRPGKISSQAGFEPRILRSGG